MSRKKGVVFSYILLILEMGSSLLFTPFLIRSLGQAEYGVFSLINSITAYLLLLDLGVGNAIVKYMAKYRIRNEKNNQCNFLAITTLFYIIVGVIVICIGLVLQNQLPNIFSKGLTNSELGLAKTLLSLTMINAAITLAIAPYDKTIIAFEKFSLSKTMLMLKLIVRVGASTVALILGCGAVEIVSINLCTTIIFAFVSVFYVCFKLKVRPSLTNVDTSLIKEIVGYSIFVFIQMVATQINLMVDNILLGIMTSSVIIGIYSVGAQINNYFQSVAGSITGVLMPGVVRIVEEKASAERIENEMVRVGRYTFMLLALIYGTFLLVGRQFVIMWAGQENSDAFWVTAIILFPMVFSMTQAIGSQVLWAINKHKIQAILKISVSLLNIALTVLLIRWKPIIGASIGTAISMLIGDVVVMNIVYRKYIHISIGRYFEKLFKGILPCLIVSITTGYLSTLFKIQGILGFAIVCSVVVAIYIFAMWVYGMNESEKRLIKNVLKKFRIKSS